MQNGNKTVHVSTLMIAIGRGREGSRTALSVKIYNKTWEPGLLQRPIGDGLARLWQTNIFTTKHIWPPKEYFKMSVIWTANLLRIGCNTGLGNPHRFNRSG
jgi:hypothetical protein